MRQIALLYHDIVRRHGGASGFPGAEADLYKLDEGKFVAHLDRIAELGPGHVGWLTARASGTGHAMLTFDDGGVSGDEPVSRLLEGHGWRGSFFIVTGRIGQPGFLSREQIRALHRRGHHIGSHSHSHPARFSTVTWDEMVREWADSRKILEDIVEERIYSASVPGGYYSRRVAQAAVHAGYTVMFNSEPTAGSSLVDGMSVRGRYWIRRHTSPESAQALARGDVLPRARQALMWNAKRPLKRIGGSAWLRVRRWLIERSSRRKPHVEEEQHASVAAGTRHGPTT